MRRFVISNFSCLCRCIKSYSRLYAFLKFFCLANSSNAEKCSWHIIYPCARFIDYKELKGFTEKVMELVGEPYSKFIDNGLPKTHFNLQLLGSAKEGRIKRPAIFSVKNGFQKLGN